MRVLKENEIYVLMKHEAYECGNCIGVSFSFEKIQSLFHEKAKSLVDEIGPKGAVFKETETTYEIYDDGTHFEIYIEDIL